MPANVLLEIFSLRCVQIFLLHSCVHCTEQKTTSRLRKTLYNQTMQRRDKYERCHVNPAKVSKFSADE